MPQAVPGAFLVSARQFSCSTAPPYWQAFSTTSISPYPLPKLLWATGAEKLDAVALEWRRTLVRVRIADLWAMTGAVWLPAQDVRQPLAEATARSPTHVGAASPRNRPHLRRHDVVNRRLP